MFSERIHCPFCNDLLHYKSDNKKYIHWKCDHHKNHKYTLFIYKNTFDERIHFLHKGDFYITIIRANHYSSNYNEVPELLIFCDESVRKNINKDCEASTIYFHSFRKINSSSFVIKNLQASSKDIIENIDEIMLLA